MDRGLSAAEVGRAARLSTASVSRIERGLVPRVSVYTLARLHAVVGLELSVRSYPAGQPIRDTAHASLLADFHRWLHRSVRWSIEVPLPIAGDARAWDAVVRGDGWIYGVEAETAPRDAQALVRRLQLKERDGKVDGVLLILRRTVQTSRFLREAGSFVRAAFPADGARALELLRAGVDPGGGAVIVVPAHRGPAPVAPPATTAASTRGDQADARGLLPREQLRDQDPAGTSR